MDPEAAAASIARLCRGIDTIFANQSHTLSFETLYHSVFTLTSLKYVGQPEIGGGWPWWEENGGG